MDIQYLPRRGEGETASIYLERRYGLRMSAAVLDQHAARGTGPKFVIMFGKAVYRAADLDAWADANTLTPEQAKARRRAAIEAARRRREAAAGPVPRKRAVGE